MKKTSFILCLAAVLLCSLCISSLAAAEGALPEAAAISAGTQPLAVPDISRTPAAPQKVYIPDLAIEGSVIPYEVYSKLSYTTEWEVLLDYATPIESGETVGQFSKVDIRVRWDIPEGPEGHKYAVPVNPKFTWNVNGKIFDSDYEGDSQLLYCWDAPTYDVQCTVTAEIGSQKIERSASFTVNVGSMDKLYPPLPFTPAAGTEEHPAVIEAVKGNPVYLFPANDFYEVGKSFTLWTIESPDSRAEKSWFLPDGYSFTPSQTGTYIITASEWTSSGRYDDIDKPDTFLPENRIPVTEKGVWEVHVAEEPSAAIKIEGILVNNRDPEYWPYFTLEQAAYANGRLKVWLSADTARDGLEYQWQKRKSNTTESFTDIAGAAEDILVLNDMPSAEGYDFRCIVSDGTTSCESPSIPVVAVPTLSSSWCSATLKTTPAYTFIYNCLHFYNAVQVQTGENMTFHLDYVHPENAQIGWEKAESPAGPFAPIPNEQTDTLVILVSAQTTRTYYRAVISAPGATSYTTDAIGIAALGLSETFIAAPGEETPPSVSPSPGLTPQPEPTPAAIAFTVTPNSALSGDIITPSKEAGVTSVTAVPAGGSWTVNPRPARGISPSGSSVAINAGLLQPGEYILTYRAPDGKTKSVKVVQPQIITDIPPVLTVPAVPVMAGYQSGCIKNKNYFVKTSGFSTLYYLKSTSGRMARVSAPYADGSNNMRFYPINIDGTVLFPRVENGKATCFCVYDNTLEIPVLTVNRDVNPLKDANGYQTGKIDGREYYVKTSGASTMFYLKSSSGRMARVSAPYVTDATGTRCYPVNYGGTVLFPKLTDGVLRSYVTGSGEEVMTLI